MVASDASDESCTRTSATARAMSLASESATLTSAVASAGESLIPSPTMTTVWPWSLRRWTWAALSSGSTWAK